jgi:hypothetical protein
LDTAIQQFLEAHVQHELARFQSRRMRESIRDEVAAAFEWATRTTLADIISAEQITDLIGRNVVAMPLPSGIAELAVSMSQRVLAAKTNKTTSIKDICARPAYDAAVAKIGSMEVLRRALIHSIVTSPIYTNEISSALYTGIKEYMLTENVLAQKVPGLASLIKLGSFAVNKTMKPLEAAVEKTIKAYIQANLGNTIRRSETSINEYFDEPHILAFGDDMWTQWAATRLSKYTQWVDSKDMTDIVALGRDFWLHFRETPYFKAVYTDLVQATLELYGDMPLSQLATEFGVNEKRVTKELTLTLAKAVETAKRSGYLEQRIRARLEDFYRSPHAAQLFASAGKSTGPAQPKAPVAEQKTVTTQQKAAARATRTPRAKPTSSAKAKPAKSG